MTPSFASLLFIAAWTAIAVATVAWTWRRWRRTREQRVVHTWFGEIEQSNFPRMFAVLSASEIVGVVVAMLLSFVGLYVFGSMLGS